MALVGFLCISLVRDRKAWIATAAFLLSLGHYWPGAVQSAGCYQGYRRGPERRSLWDAVVLPLRTTPCCILRRHERHFPTFSFDKQNDVESSIPAGTSPGAPARLLPSVTAHVNQHAFRATRLLLAQLARGPPRRA